MTSKLDWKPLDVYGTVWVSTCGRFAVAADSVKRAAREALPSLAEVRDEEGASLREAALWAQAEVDSGR